MCPTPPPRGAHSNPSPGTSLPSASLWGSVPQFPHGRLPLCRICAGARGGSQAHPSPPSPRVADGPCGQEPPAGDGAHGASAGHRLVPPQRQRHRQRLRGHHRYGEGRAAGGLRRAPPPHPFPVALLPAKCHRPIFSGGAMCVCAAGGGRWLHDAALCAKYTLPATQHRGGHVRHNSAVPPPPNPPGTTCSLQHRDVRRDGGGTAEVNRPRVPPRCGRSPTTSPCAASRSRW